MLFDFFACINFNQKQQIEESPFLHQPPYSKLQYQERQDSSPVSEVISLHKGAKDSSSLFQNEQIEVYIYGYCITRLNSDYFTKKQKLSAHQLANAYQEIGDDFLDHVKGSFAILLIDKAAGKAKLYTDPFNVRPVYYMLHEQAFYISTSMATLVHQRQRLHLSNDLNYPAIIEYHLFEYSLKDDTYIKSIQNMPAGGSLTFSAGNIDLKKYWEAFRDLEIPGVQYSEKESVEGLNSLLKENLDMYLFYPERTAVALTGGYDSRTNLALLGNKSKDFFFYSYGSEGTFDLSIPANIAATQNLHYKQILLDQNFQQYFGKYAKMAIALGDGIAEASRANYPFAFRQLSPRYDYILTGLFGSELIKHPTSIGNFINQDMKDLLRSNNPEKTLDNILQKARTENIIDEEIMDQYAPEVRERVLSEPYVVNQHDFPVKYFYFLLMQGIRKYFMKEIKVERPFVSNIHPFLDLEFVELLLQTPFPWVYHWTGEKNLVRSLKTHRFYVSIMQRNRPALTRMLSTHGYTPAFIRHKMLLPVMALQYRYYKSRIRASGSFNSTEAVTTYLQKQLRKENRLPFLHLENTLNGQNTKEMIKMASLQQWMNTHQLNQQSVGA
jgi:hypothetical protein